VYKFEQEEHIYTCTCTMNQSMSPGQTRLGERHQELVYNYEASIYTYITL